MSKDILVKVGTISNEILCGLSSGRHVKSVGLATNISQTVRKASGRVDAFCRGKKGFRKQRQPMFKILPTKKKHMNKETDTVEIAWSAIEKHHFNKQKYFL
jgi:hypothetical protein